MKTPTLEEVKEHFKNAKEVRCANRKKDIGIVELDKFKFSSRKTAIIQNPYSKNWIVLWDFKNGYAEIISYKDPNDKHVQSVINKFSHRSEVGFAKYGTTLERKDLNLTEWLNHLQEELMDATLYIEKLKDETNTTTTN